MAESTGGLSGAADRIRETAKWFAVSVAAIGGVVAAGLQLTDIGQFDIASLRLWLAVLGAVLALAGALTILWVVVGTMTGDAVSLDGIATETPTGAEGAVADPTLLGAYDSAAAMREEYLDALRRRRTAFDDARANPGVPEKVDAATLADNRAVAIDQTVGTLLEVVSYQHLAHTWRMARKWIVGGAILATIGFGLFAWAANPPEDAAASEAAANVLTSPKAGQARLTTAGMDALKDSVGDGCWADPASAPTPSASATGPVNSQAVTLKVLVLAKTEAGPDVIIDQSGCNKVRVLLTTDWGSVNQ